MSKSRFKADGKWGKLQWTDGEKPEEENKIMNLILRKEALKSEQCPPNRNKEEYDTEKEEKLNKMEKEIWDLIYKERLKKLPS